MVTSKVGESRKRQKTGGRVAGTPNKITAELKETILKALDNVGGVSYLERTAESHPAAFLSLVGKVLPMTVAGTGEDGAIVITAIERRIIKSK
mgnify:CR=1 FL=1